MRARRVPSAPGRVELESVPLYNDLWRERTHHGRLFYHPACRKVGAGMAMLTPVNSLRSEFLLYWEEEGNLHHFHATSICLMSFCGTIIDRK